MPYNFKVLLEQILMRKNFTYDATFFFLLKDQMGGPNANLKILETIISLK